MIFGPFKACPFFMLCDVMCVGAVRLNHLRLAAVDTGICLLWVSGRPFCVLAQGIEVIQLLDDEICFP